MWYIDYSLHLEILFGLGDSVCLCFYTLGALRQFSLAPRPPPDPCTVELALTIPLSVLLLYTFPWKFHPQLHVLLISNVFLLLDLLPVQTFLSSPRLVLDISIQVIHSRLNLNTSENKLTSFRPPALNLPLQHPCRKTMTFPFIPVSLGTHLWLTLVPHPSQSPDSAEYLQKDIFNLSSSYTFYFFSFFSHPHPHPHLPPHTTANPYLKPRLLATLGFLSTGF